MAREVRVPVVEVAMVPVVRKDVMGAQHTTTVSTKQRLEERFQCTLGNVLPVQRQRPFLPSCPTQRSRGRTGHQLKAVTCLFPVKIVELPSRRSGAEMSMVTLSVMLVVGFFFFFFLPNFLLQPCHNFAFRLTGNVIQVCTTSSTVAIDPLR